MRVRVCGADMYKVAVAVYIYKGRRAPTYPWNSTVIYVKKFQNGATFVDEILARWVRFETC